METPGAKFVAMILGRLQALEGEVQRQSGTIDGLQKRARVPQLATPSISSEQMAFGDGTAIHWALGRPAGMYVSNVLVPLAPPYSEVVVARGPSVVFVSDYLGTGFTVDVSPDVGKVALGELVERVNAHLTSTAGHWSLLEPFMGRTAWQLKQTPFGIKLEVDLDVPVSLSDGED